MFLSRRKNIRITFFYPILVTSAYNGPFAFGNILRHKYIGAFAVHFIIRVGVCYPRKNNFKRGGFMPVNCRKKKYFFHMLKILTFMLKKLILFSVW